MYGDFKELLSALNAHKVKYLIVGAWAVARHAQPRATKDLDVLVQPTLRNGAALFQALQEFAAPLADLTPADLIERGSFFRMGVPPIAIDILNEISGVTFDKAWRSRVTLEVDETTGLKAHFISAGDLIAAKMAAGRPQDIADADAIRSAQVAASPKKHRSSGTAKPKRKRKAQE